MASYTVSDDDLAALLTVRVSQTDRYGAVGSVTSAATGAITDAKSLFYADGFGVATVDGKGTSTLDFSALTQDLTFTLGADGSVIVTQTATPGLNRIVATAFGDLVGGTGANRFVFVGSAAIDGTITGNSSGTTILDYSASTLPVTVNLATRGASGTGGVTNVTRIIGSTVNGASNTLLGRGGGLVWSITGSGAGSVDGIEFSGFQTLGAGGDDGRLDYSDYGTAVTVNLATGAASGFSRIDGFRQVFGSAYGDHLTGDTFDNLISGGAGSDVLAGGGGEDTVYALADADMTLTDGGLVVGTADIDTLDGFSRARLVGGAGANVLDASGFTLGPVELSGRGATTRSAAVAATTRSPAGRGSTASTAARGSTPSSRSARAGSCSVTRRSTWARGRAPCRRSRAPAR